MNEEEQLLKMIEVQKEHGVITDSEYNRMYHRITGNYRLTLEQAQAFEESMLEVRHSITNLLSLGLITEAKAKLLQTKANAKLMKLASEGKLNEKED
tara:strand:- start:494 stop:784 length:291 start_codon:yes stop_codon:yes gene_type:complete